MDKVSVIVPVYQPEIDLLIRALNSVLQQTWQNLELLLVIDDPKLSSKHLCEILTGDWKTDEGQKEENAEHKVKPYLDSRIRILHTEGGTGVSAARNLGIEKSEGIWICFLDQDDYYAVSFVETLVNSVQQQKTEMAMSGFEMVDGNCCGVSSFPREEIMPNETWLYWSTCAIWNRIYSRSVLEKYQIRFPQKCYTEDMLFVLQCNEHLSFGDVVSERLYYNYQNPQSTSRSEHFRQLNLDQMPWQQLRGAMGTREYEKDCYAVGFILNELVLLTCILSRGSKMSVGDTSAEEARKVWQQLANTVDHRKIDEFVSEYLRNAELSVSMKLLMKGYYAALRCKVDRLYCRGIRRLLRLLRA